MDDIKSSIRELARSEGFDAVGFTLPALASHAKQGLQGFLEGKHHGEMHWMQDNADRRADPMLIWPEARSIIVVGHNYAPLYNPMEKLSQDSIGNISCYAQNEDYHEVIKKKLRALARVIAERFNADVKLFVDTAPVMEKPLAEQSGIGWQGKHTCLVSREFGSWLFLGEIFTTLAIAPDEPEKDHCGSCTACIDICPTHAITAPHTLDARKCISYLTIEHKGVIDMQYRKAIGNRIYGCDDCLAVCPWNKFAQTSHEIAYHPRSEFTAPDLSELVSLDDKKFRALFKKSPIKRIGRDRFIRNVLIAIGNAKGMFHVEHINARLSDDSALVRGMAVWALSQLVTAEKFSTMKAQYFALENDAQVQQEWMQGEHYG